MYLEALPGDLSRTSRMLRFKEWSGGRPIEGLDFPIGESGMSKEIKIATLENLPPETPLEEAAIIAGLEIFGEGSREGKVHGPKFTKECSKMVKRSQKPCATSCFNCGDPSHIWHKCPQPLRLFCEVSGLGNTHVRDCLKCGNNTKPHYKPKPRKTRRTLATYEQNLSFVPCHNCGMRGHMWSGCPRPLTLFCTKCGLEDIHPRDCTWCKRSGYKHKRY